MLQSGYSEDQAKEFTAQYFPDFFSKPSSESFQELAPDVDDDSKGGFFIPVRREVLFNALLNHHGSEKSEALNSIITMLESIWHHHAHADLIRLKTVYNKLNPELQTNSYSRTDVEEFISRFEKTLNDGNWVGVSQDEIDEALDGEDLLPISLNVRFDEFRTMKVYKLGERQEMAEKSTFFGLRQHRRKVRVFEHLITLLEFQEDSWFDQHRKRRLNRIDGPLSGLHVRLFKHVPHLDMEVIFPNTSPSMRVLDKIKIVAPLVGGLFSLAMKYLPALFGGDTGDTSLSLLGGVLAGIGTYVVKTYTTYQKTRENFRKIVARDMYFKGLANDQTVLNYVLDLGEEQEVKEAALAYVFLLQSSTKLTEQELDQVVEHWLHSTFGVDVDFEVDDALAKLKRMNLLSEHQGRLSVVNPEVALQILDDYWDSIFEF